MLGILYDAGTGGFTLSEITFSEYQKRTDIDLRSYIYSPKVREDPVLIDIFREIADKINGSEDSHIDIAYIPHRYANFYRIEYVAGKEHIIIQYDKYKSTTIRDFIVYQPQEMTGRGHSYLLSILRDAETAPIYGKDDSLQLINQEQNYIPCLDD